MIYGALILGFLLAEPLGLTNDNMRNYFLVWPFKHSRRRSGFQMVHHDKEGM
jgi:branched-chain amino acid transport system permease protein